MKVGLIGCGRIANEAHVPAYKKYGVDIVAVCDLLKEKAQNIASKEENIICTTDPIELAKHGSVELIDVATQPGDRVELIRKLLPFKKPLLVQKPFSYKLSDLLEVYEESKKHNVPIAVNHNARWAPVSSQIKEWIDSDKIGEVYAIHHVNRFNEDLDKWYTRHPDYLFLDHGIHYIDLIRWFTNEKPLAVSAVSTFKPGQKAKCPLLYSMHFIYEKKSLQVSMYFNNVVPVPHGFHCDWFIDGTKGSIRATIDSASLMDDVETKVQMQKLNGEWVPDGFYGSYKNFRDALNEGKAPQHSLKDHIETFKVALAAAKSANNKGEWTSCD